MITEKISINQLVMECKSEQDINKRAEILFHINAILPDHHKLKIPSLITDDYIDSALYEIEKKLNL
jgi:hypothetical protein